MPEFSLLRDSLDTVVKDISVDAKLLGISKRGNPYLRKMFIHGARAAVLRVKREGSSLGK